MAKPTERKKKDRACCVMVGPRLQVGIDAQTISGCVAGVVDLATGVTP